MVCDGDIADRLVSNSYTGYQTVVNRGVRCNWRGLHGLEMVEETWSARVRVTLIREAQPGHAPARSGMDVVVETLTVLKTGVQSSSMDGVSGFEQVRRWLAGKSSPSSGTEAPGGYRESWQLACVPETALAKMLDRDRASATGVLGACMRRRGDPDIFAVGDRGSKVKDCRHRAVSLVALARAATGNGRIAAGRDYWTPTGRFRRPRKAPHLSNLRGPPIAADARASETKLTQLGETRFERSTSTRIRTHGGITRGCQVPWR